MSRPVRILTWNIHGAVGADRVCDPDRVLAILRRIDADILLLQEVDGRTHLGRKAKAFETFSEALGLHGVEARMFGKPGREHGNLLWSRWPIVASRVHRLPGGHEPRGLIEAVIDTPSGRLRVLGSHFSLSPPARRKQAALIASLVVDPSEATVALGDFNEWRRGGPVHRALSAVLPVALCPPTWPARRPFVRMDRLYVGRDVAVRALPVPPEARQASDHLPVLAELVF